MKGSKDHVNAFKIKDKTLPNSGLVPSPLLPGACPFAFSFGGIRGRAERHCPRQWLKESLCSCLSEGQASGTRTTDPGGTGLSWPRLTMFSKGTGAQRGLPRPHRRSGQGPTVCSVLLLMILPPSLERARHPSPRASKAGTKLTSIQFSRSLDARRNRRTLAPSCRGSSKLRPEMGFCPQDCSRVRSLLRISARFAPSSL